MEERYEYDKRLDPTCIWNIRPRAVRWVSRSVNNIAPDLGSILHDLHGDAVIPRVAGTFEFIQTLMSFMNCSVYWNCQSLSWLMLLPLNLCILSFLKHTWYSYDSSPVIAERVARNSNKCHVSRLFHKLTATLQPDEANLD